ncbi:MAG: YdcF family protein [Alphaproteobacteria bacterium]|nr:YdcF family protein [Alphaproteobacteria bacterium]
MRKVFFLFFLIFLAYSVGFYFFWKKIQSYAIQNEKKDAVVVLTGDRGRIQEGLTLVKTKKAKILFISGIQTEKDAENLFKQSRQIAKDKIVLGRRAFDTIGNAQETKQWLARTPNVVQFYLVTSDYHLPRSMVVFESLLKGYEITPYPVKSEKSVLFLMKEYTKYILASVWHSLGMESRL